MSVFHLSIGLSMVRWNPDLLYAHKLTKLSDDVAFTVGSSDTQELGQCSQDWDISLPQNLATVFAAWLRVTYAIMCLIKWSQKTKRFTMFGGWSNTGKVNVQKQWWVTLVLWHDCLHAGCIAHSCWSPSTFVWPFLPTRTGNVATT